MKKNYPFLLFFFIPCFLFSQWNADPAVNTPVCVQPNQQYEHRIMPDGKGGAFIVWRDRRDYSTLASDIYIQRLDANGNRLWKANGVEICKFATDQSTPFMVSDGNGGAIVTWSDWRSGIERDIYAQRIDSNGNVLWTPNGVIVTDKPDREHTPRIVSDDAGGAIICWEQQSGGTWYIWAQRISSSGTRMWGNGGTSVCTSPGKKINAKIQKDKSGGAYIAWQDRRSGVYDIYAQRMSPSGARLWGDAGKAVCTATGVQNNLKIDFDSASAGIFVAWSDDRNGNNDIYAQRLNSSGTLLWTANAVPVCTAAGNQGAVDIMGSSKVQGVIITWKDERGSDVDIYAQKLDYNGTAQWAANGVPVCNAANDQLNPNIISDGRGNAIVAWQDGRTGTFDIYTQKINGSSGAMEWNANGVQVGTAANAQTDPKNCSDDNGGCIYVFADMRNGTDRDVYAHHLFCDGTATAKASDCALEVDCSLATTLYFPNAFSPNGDGENDELMVYGDTACILEFTIRIYSRWGKMVFESDDHNFKWNGESVKGKNFNTGAHAYYMRAVFKNKMEIKKQGSISILR